MAKKEPAEKLSPVISVEERNAFANFFMILMDVDKRVKAKKASERESRKAKIKVEEKGLLIYRPLVFFNGSFIFNFLSARIPSHLPCWA